MKFIFYILIFVFLFSISCDVPGKIILKNMSGYTATYEYEIIVNEDNLKRSSINLGVDQGQDQAEILFGFGHRWTEEEIKEYLEKINYIEIATSVDTIKLNTKEEMFNFFIEKRGIFKKNVKVKIK